MTEWELVIGPRELPLRICEWGPSDGASTNGATPADAPPVLILHGFLEQGAAWEGVARRLGRRVLAPDHRGHGLSGHVGAGGWYHFWDYVGDVDAIVEHLGGPVDLVGHSMGGTIACLFAGSRPDRVRKLVLVEGLGPPDAGDDVLVRARQYLADRRSPPGHRPMRDLAEAVDRVRKANPSLHEEEARRLVERTTRPGAPAGTGTGDGLVWTWDPLHRARMPVPFQASVFVRFLREITAPVLLVDGGRSPWILPDAQERMAALAVSRREVVVRAGHLVHHDAPDALARLVRAFLDEIA